MVVPLTTGQVIRWWELRRLAYNAILLVIGVATIAGYEWLVTKLIPLGEDAIEPMGLVVGVVVYAGLANLCYTLGWVVELRGRKTDPIARFVYVRLVKQERVLEFFSPQRRRNPVMGGLSFLTSPVRLAR